MIQREPGDGTYASHEEEGFEPTATIQPSRYCLMVSQSSVKTCKHRAQWWVSYLSEYGLAAKATCDQHLAAALRYISRRHGDSSHAMPRVFAIED